jgi:hypothetical protein
MPREIINIQVCTGILNIPIPNMLTTTTIVYAPSAVTCRLAR